MAIPGSITTNSSATLLMSEVLDKVHKAKTKEKKISLLREHDTQALRMVLKSSFDPKIEWMMPEGEVPFTPNDVPAGTEHTRLASEARKLYRFVRGGDNEINQMTREKIFIQMLEGLHVSEANLVINAKDKKLHQVYKGLSAAVVKEAFGWNDDYVKPE